MKQVSFAMVAGLGLIFAGCVDDGGLDLDCLNDECDPLGSDDGDAGPDADGGGIDEGDTETEGEAPEAVMSGTFVDTCISDRVPVTIVSEFAGNGGGMSAGYYTDEYRATLASEGGQEYDLFIQLISYYPSGPDAPDAEGVFELTPALLDGDTATVVIELVDRYTGIAYAAIPNTGTLTISVMPKYVSYDSTEEVYFDGCIDVNIGAAVDPELSGGECSGRINYCWSALYERSYC